MAVNATPSAEVHLARALGAFILLLMGLLIPAQIPAQQIDAGSRIRVTRVSGGGRDVGSLVSLDADSLRYTAADTTRLLAIPVSSVARLERSLGRKSSAARGALIGGLVGAGLGLVLGVAASGDDDGFYDVGVEDVAAVTALLGAVGGGVGALIGSASRRERWESVPVATGIVRASVPRRLLARATVNIRF